MSVQLRCFAVQSLTKRDSRHISFITCSILPTTIKQLIQLYLHSPYSASVLPNSLKDQYFSNFLYLTFLWCLSCNYFLSFSLHKSELYPPLIYVVGSGFLVSFGFWLGVFLVVGLWGLVFCLVGVFLKQKHVRLRRDIKSTLL